MKRMRPCDRCHRHVFATEQTCPFCSAALAPVPESAPLAVPSSASRAQRLALAAALGGQSLLACADAPTDPVLQQGNTTPPQAGNTAGKAGANSTPPVAMPVYGAPVPGGPPVAPPAAGTHATAGGAAPPPAARGPIAVPVYGAPVAGGPASDDDAGVPDAGTPAAGSGGKGAPVPVYGAPVPVYGAPPTPRKD